MRKNLLIAVILCSFIPHKSYALFGFGNVERAGVPIIEATELGNAEYVKTLINQGADINAVDKNGQTALIKAAAAGNDQMVAILITNGADIQIQDRKGNSALHYAAANDQASTTQMLISNGAIVNITNRRGQTPLELAIKNGSVYAIRVIDPGALSVVETNAGFTIAAASAGAAGGGISTTAVVTTATGVAAAGAGIAAAAGGGGGGSDETSSSDGGSAPDNGSGGGSNPDGGSDSGDGSGGDNSGGGGSGTDASQLIFPSADPFVGNKLVNSYTAHNRGYTGSGVTVAVIDTGVDLNHKDLVNNVISGRSFFDDGSEGGDGSEEGPEIFPGQSISGDFWHGTHVAGIIASQNSSGGSEYSVAPDAKILPVNVYTYSESTIYNSDVAAGIDYSVSQGARVINISLGGSDSGVIKSSIQNAVDVIGEDSIVVAAAAGNLYADDAISVADNPVYPARHAGDSNINPGFPDNTAANIDRGALLAVGAVDQNGTIAAFSHKCGDAMNWCLVAPGEYYVENGIGQRKYYGILSSMPDDLYAYTRGTSMATPYVSGAAAVVMDMAEQEGTVLTGRQVAEILLLTATDKGDAGVDEVYGHGLLNLDKATQPLGVPSVYLGNNITSTSVSLNVSSINVSHAFGDAVSGSNLSFMIMDDYKRAFYVDIADVNYEQNSFTVFEDKFRDFGQDVTLQRESISENVSFTAVNLSDNDPSIEEHEKEEFVRMSFSANSEHGGVGFNYNVPMNQAFRMSALNDVSTSMDNVGTNSVLGLVSRGTSYSNHYVLDKNSSVSFGSFQGEQEYGDVSGVVSQYTRRHNMLEMSAQFGMINEENSFLGSKTDGAFSIGENTPTWFYNFASAYNFLSKVKLFGSINYGISFPQAGTDSLINDISQIQTYSFSSGVSKKGVFDEHDKMEFVVSQPLRVIDGSANVVLPVARDFDGNIYTASSDLSLSPSGRQIDIGAFYTMPFSKKSNVSAGAVYMTEPGHNKNADDEMVFMSKFSLEF